MFNAISFDEQIDRAADRFGAGWMGTTSAEDPEQLAAGIIAGLSEGYGDHEEALRHLLTEKMRNLVQPDGLLDETSQDSYDLTGKLAMQLYDEIGAQGRVPVALAAALADEIRVRGATSQMLAAVDFG